MRRTVTYLAIAAAMALTGCAAQDSGNDTADGGAIEAPAEAADEAGSTSGDRVITQAVQEAPGREIVYTVDLSIETDDIAKATRSATAITVAAGGFVADEYTDGDVSSMITLKVPVAAHADAVGKLEALGEVTGRTRTTQDVTQEVVDTESRIASQQASIERIRTLLAEATDIGEIISIESELASREADLDALLSKQKELSALTSMATVTVSFSTPEDEQDETDLGFLSGLQGGWDAFSGAVAITLTLLGALLPFLLAAAVIGAPVWFAVRSRRTASPAVTEPEITD